MAGILTYFSAVINISSLFNIMGRVNGNIYRFMKFAEQLSKDSREISSEIEPALAGGRNTNLLLSSDRHWLIV